jgi:serine/threonine protein phosphatase PrpC
MQKRVETPLLSNKNVYEKVLHNKKKYNIPTDANKLVLPSIKNNMDEISVDLEEFKNHYPPKSSKQIAKARNSFDFSNKKILSPIQTESKNKKKRSAKMIENNSKYTLNTKGKNTTKIIKIKEFSNENKEEKKSRNVNKFNINNKKNNFNIKTEAFPFLNKSRNNSKVKFPLIETRKNHIKSDKILNNLINNENNETTKPSPHISDTSLIYKNMGEPIKYATFSKKGTNEDGKEKEYNQDSSIILNNVCEIDNYCIYGIMDGHGSNGHLASNFVKEKIEEYFNNRNIYKSKKLNKTSSSIEVNLSNKMYENLRSNDYEIIRNFYKKVNDELYNTKFDVHFSGTTCVLVFRIGKKLICSNVGDSRAVLIKEIKGLNDNNYEFIALSHDHKPEKKEERERIEKLGGEVDQEYLTGTENKPIGPFRVWNKGCDYPGLAISRSLGDKIAELIGVICDPEILEFDLDDNCKYIIMGSDGLFDYLPNKDIMDIAGSYLIKNYSEMASIVVVEKASKLFSEKEKRIDDITINVIIL